MEHGKRGSAKSSKKLCNGRLVDWGTEGVFNWGGREGKKEDRKLAVKILNLLEVSGVSNCCNKVILLQYFLSTKKALVLIMFYSLFIPSPLPIFF